MKLVIIACSVLKYELMKVGLPGIQFEFLDQGLHRTPNKMPLAIQERISQIGEKTDYIMLGYGLCGNGIVGVKAEKQPLVIPKVHDCISFWFGSIEAHRKEHAKASGTYYLTKGWFEEARPPLASFEENTQRFGLEDAKWIANEEFKNYTRIALIDTGAYEIDAYRARAQANADFLGIAYEEVKGSLNFFRKMVKGKWAEGDFIILQPGEYVTSEIVLPILESKAGSR